MATPKYFPYGEREIAHLKAADPTLGAAIDRLGPLKRAVDPDLFASLVESVIGQLISGKAQATICSRLSERCGGTITAEALSSLDVETIKRCGISMRKARTIEDITARVRCGALDLEHLYTLDDEEVVTILSAIPGIGRWTAEMILIFALMRPDVFSWGDPSIRRGLCHLHNLEQLTKKEFEVYRERYSPYNTTASLYIWALS